jgi:integrase
MAHISSKTNSKGETVYRYHIHRKGYPTTTKGGFKTYQACKDAATIEEAHVTQHGQPTSIREAKKHTVRDVIDKYLLEIECSSTDMAMLRKLREAPIAAISLAYVQKKDAYAYLDQRSQATRMRDGVEGKISSTSIAREVNLIRAMLFIADDKWGWIKWGLTNPNPFQKLKLAQHYGKVLRRRKRRLKDGELEKLIDACKQCHGDNRCYLPLVINLAIETGMRRQEILNLTVADIDTDNRRIEIRKSKTDHVTEYEGRTIVMTVIAKRILEGLNNVQVFKSMGFKPEFAEIDASGPYVNMQVSDPILPATAPLPTDQLIPMKHQAFAYAWHDLVRRAGLYEIKTRPDGTKEKDYLHFHDLRHEAACRFHEAGLDDQEQDLMIGYTSKHMRDVYIHSMLSSIQNKLDRDQLGGLTDEEWQSKQLKASDAVAEAKAIAEQRQRTREETERRIDQTAKVIQLSSYRRRKAS